MSASPLLQAAVRNNAAWCQLVCASHSLPGELLEMVWCSPQETPRYYPNIVTLNENCSAEDIAALMQQRAGAWSVKDSFNKFDLAPLGFTKLFDAEWLAFPKANTAMAYDFVRDETELAAWENAWCSGQPEGLFQPSLLDNQDVAVVAIHQNAKIIAGAIGNKTGDTVGISNIFCPADNPQDYWLACIAALQQRFPGTNLVGYEGGEELQLAVNIGCISLGPLSVWAK